MDWLLRTLKTCLMLPAMVCGVASATSFAGSGVGLIPDGGSLPCPSPGNPLNITFNVTGMSTAALSDIRVSMTFAATHPWGGDLSALLISPTGVSFPLFGAIGATSARHPGTRQGFSGTYLFVDPGISGNNIWTAASGALSAGTIPPGTYATTPVGGAGATNPPAATGLLAAFSGLTTAAQINGAWLLRVVDRCAGDSGSLTAATLTLQQGAAPLQFAYAPTVMDFGNVPNQTSALKGATVYAPASNMQSISVSAAANVCEIPFSTDFRLLTNFLSIAPGDSGAIAIEYKPGRAGGPPETTANFYCTVSGAPGQDPIQIQLKGSSTAPLPAANCYDVDGDGVLNPLVDGLLITRLQLGLSATTAANGISFAAPRSTAKRVIGFMAEQCGLTP